MYKVTGIHLEKYLLTFPGTPTNCVKDLTEIDRIQTFYCYNGFTSGVYDGRDASVRPWVALGHFSCNPGVISGTLHPPKVLARLSAPVSLGMCRTPYTCTAQGIRSIVQTMVPTSRDQHVQCVMK